MKLYRCDLCAVEFDEDIEWPNDSQQAEMWETSEHGTRSQKRTPTPSANDWKGSSMIGQRRGQLSEWILFAAGSPVSPSVVAELANKGY